MGGGFRVDAHFDVRAEAAGRDPDTYSKTLRAYHRLLWSKTLPSGVIFDLDAALHHTSDGGHFRLSSDTIAATYTRWRRPARLVDAVRRAPPDEVRAFSALACTVGAFLIFPLAERSGGKGPHSINQARGINPRIADRFDLTLECIRRHYLGTVCPLSAVLDRHSDFFELFGNFPGYVDHFLLNDLVSDDYRSVRFFTTFTDFADDPLPAASVSEYRSYMSRSTEFVTARNVRIDAYALPASQDGP